LTASGHERMHGQEIERKERSRENIKKAVKAAPAWHKSKEGRQWHSESHKGMKMPRIEKICDLCGCSFMGTKTQRFCSNACKSAYRRKLGLDDVDHVCLICGKTFKSSRFEERKYCSKECASRGHVGWNKR
jgi:hypothetical protein